mmetsp:Transcript_9397/g.39890  ORF Transcript_9397/g.39890 Transcript_9397/m.39890 type:complete len:300 (+) Transcript_9397:1209-2108(+)
MNQPSRRASSRRARDADETTPSGPEETPEGVFDPPFAADRGVRGDATKPSSPSSSSSSSSRLDGSTAVTAVSSSIALFAIDSARPASVDRFDRFDRLDRADLADWNDAPLRDDAASSKTSSSSEVSSSSSSSETFKAFAPETDAASFVRFFSEEEGKDSSRGGVSTSSASSTERDARRDVPGVAGYFFRVFLVTDASRRSAWSPLCRSSSDSPVFASSASLSRTFSKTSSSPSPRTASGGRRVSPVRAARSETYSSIHTTHSLNAETALCSMTRSTTGCSAQAPAAFTVMRAAMAVRSA